MEETLESKWGQERGNKQTSSFRKQLQAKSKEKYRAPNRWSF